MRALCFADPHMREGRNGELKTGIQLFNCINKTADRENCNAVFLIGDAWHEKYGVNYAVLTALRKCLLKMARNKLVYWIRGNHEVSIKSEPEKSLIELFEGLHKNLIIVNKPQPIFDQQYRYGIWMLPWYPAEDWIIHAEAMSRHAQACAIPNKILMTHIGLSEGTVSSSNIYTINHKTKLSHLHPWVWDFVLMGDYHVQQFFHFNKVLYLGAPMQLAHGDVPDQGVFVLDLNGAKAVLTKVPIEGAETLPRYITYKFDLNQKMELQMLVEDPNNYVRLQVHPHLAHIARHFHSQSSRWSIEQLGVFKRSPLANNRMEEFRRMTGLPFYPSGCKRRGCSTRST